jgi:hypothetical protein
MNSPEGQAKLRRILKTWVMTNEDLVYWQGKMLFVLIAFNNITVFVYMIPILLLLYHLFEAHDFPPRRHCFTFSNYLTLLPLVAADSASSFYDIKFN